MISRTGDASSPPSISLPDAPTEKVPDTGLTPEWSPATSVTYSPSPALARRAPPGPASPGSTTRFDVPTDGGDAVRAAAGVAGGGPPRPARGAGVVEERRAAARRRSGRCGRRGAPSPSKGALDGPSGSVPSSASRRTGSATSSPSRSANSERPRWTASADSIAPMKPMNEAATKASSTTGQRRLSGWRAPTSASARSAASAPIASGRAPPGSRPMPTPIPVIRSAPSPANADA